MIEDVIHDIVTSDVFWAELKSKGLLPVIAYPAMLFGVSLLDIRRKQRKVEERIQSERLMQKIEDEAEREEEKKLKKHVAERLAMLESKMYEGLEAFTYNNGTPSRRIVIKRQYTNISIPANIYLRDYHGALKSVLFKVIKDHWIDTIESEGCADTLPNNDVFDGIVKDLRSKILSETHKKSGSNEDIEDIENKILSFEELKSFAKNTIMYSQHLRADKMRTVRRCNNNPQKKQFWKKRERKV